MKKIVLSSLMIVGLVGVVTMATRAAFSDTETSNNNTFAAGTLNLTVDGKDGENVAKFDVKNMKPGSQSIGTYKLKNVGTVNGVLNLDDISVTNNENGCAEPESEDGDTSCDNPGATQGELQNVVSLSKLFWDNDCDGWVGAGEGTIFDGKVGTIPSTITVNKALNAGAEQCVTAQFNWWNTADDNKAMGDDFTLNLGFKLSQ